MTRLQITVIAISCLLFAGIYFGTSTKPSKQKLVEQERSLVAMSTSIEAILKTAKAKLSKDTAAMILGLEQELGKSSTDSVRINVMKRLAGVWYDAGRADVSGYFAEEIANIKDDEASWSIAGTTYMIGGRQAKEQKIRDFCYDNAVRVLENAISINPANYANKVNLALCYVENPKNGPMQGIMMLREYNKQAPDNVLVLNTLARLAIQTNQFDKALERLTKVLSLEPDNKKASCLMVQVYDGMGNKEKAAEYAAKCIN